MSLVRFSQRDNLPLPRYLLDDRIVALADIGDGRDAGDFFSRFKKDGLDEMDRLTSWTAPEPGSTMDLHVSSVGPLLNRVVSEQ